MLASYWQRNLIEAGCDEAGRGCLAGPVTAAAVILPPDFYHERLNDSKQLSEADRNRLRPIIEENALAWAVAFINHTEIDRINIYKASMLAMHHAIDQLKIRPELILVDGNKFIPYLGIPHQCFVKGDGRFASIAAASILAKTHRDEYMQQLHQEFPQYHWNENKGYPTPFHKSVVKAIGASPYHRSTFKIK